ncbi:lipid-A-disaccharide synthase [Phormidium sp. LEGE 05292]|uniref:lipid-A-disaccharide synthase n=1 Tax=[Phormidium] sp. LEGE 05292 TaxID=767427 RepID=UPI00187EA7FB|nr:lipid-A-disaccharide synthase [Phormidium sp. LEGE 05292]MBE9228304.1 lipid-A-disaccharide synthase [Phormidium sp. LEGE 05292]
MLLQPSDILILSNGPGELATWVRPVVKALRQVLGNDRANIRISLILSPCPNASGKEVEIAESYPEIDRVQAPENFFSFLFTGKTAANWDWRKNGVVLFLGGDQFYTVIIGKRLNYRTVTYAEWDARWHQWIDRFAAMTPKVIAKSPQKYAHKFTIVGDLMAEAQGAEEQRSRGAEEQRSRGAEGQRSNIELIGLLPGSKPAKLAQGVPLGLAIAQQIHNFRPTTKFIIFVARTLDVHTLAKFADPQQNSIVKKLGWASAELVFYQASNQYFMKTESGLNVELCTESPPYQLLSQCRICLTTVGANTAELGALAVPMLVLIPTQQLDAMRSWDGLPGLLANTPIVGSIFAKLINWLVLQNKKLFAWPNIWAKAEIVPELVGKLQPEKVAEMVLDYLEHPEKLHQMSDRLRAVRGQSGAAEKIAQIVQEELTLAINKD